MEHYRIVALLISIVIFFGFLTWAYFETGKITKSISILFYKLEGQKRWFYTIFMWTFAVPMSIAASTPLMFWAAVCMVLTGTAADSQRNKLTEYLHVGGANLGIGLAFLSLWLDYGLLYLSLLGVAIFLLILFGNIIKNKTYWVETIAFIITVSGILINIYS